MNNNLLAGGGSSGIITNPLFKNTVFEGISQNAAVGGSVFLGLIVPKLVGLLLVFGGVSFFFMFLWGAVSWILSGGDKAHVESARSRITSALVGLILMISVFAIVGLIESFFKINILSIDIGPLVIQ